MCICTYLITKTDHEIRSCTGLNAVQEAYLTSCIFTQFIVWAQPRYDMGRYAQPQCKDLPLC